MTPLKRWSTVDLGPVGGMLAEILSYCPVADKLWISSGRDSLDVHGLNSLHNEGRVVFGGSPCAAIDIVANPQEDQNWDTTERRTIMRDTALWLLQFSVHTNELIHTSPFDTDKGFYVKDGSVTPDCTVYGCSSDPFSTAAAHANHVHFGTNAAAAQRILDSLADLKSTIPPVQPSGTGVLFGYDGSDFTSVMNFSGLSFVTHKVTEAVSSGEVYEHTKFGPVMEAARAQGVPFLGAYVVPRSGGFTPDQEADVAIAAVRRQAPWVLDHPGFFWQSDLEKWPYDSVPVADGVALLTALRNKTGKPGILYASKGQYGDSIPGNDLLWNANYPGGNSDTPAAMYAALGGQGWVNYSGRTPTVWQFADNARFADGNRGDANAFRGSVDDFKRIILGQTGDEDMTPEQAAKLDLIEQRLYNIEHGTFHTMSGDDAPAWHMGDPPNPNDPQPVANVPANLSRTIAGKVDALSALVHSILEKMDAQAPKA